MKRTLLLLCAILLLCAGCVPQPIEQETTQATTEPVTIDPALLPDVYEDASAFFEAGNIELHVPDAATDVTQAIIHDEISQTQFMLNEVFYTYRAAFASTGRTGYALTDIVEALEYIDTEEDLQYTNAQADYAFEVHQLENGALLLWSDGEINYSLASYGGTFDDLRNTADQIIK